jgi:hypothetical protein
LGNGGFGFLQHVRGWKMKKLVGYLLLFGFGVEKREMEE